PRLAHRHRARDGTGLLPRILRPALLDGRAEPAPGARHLHPVRRGDFAAGRLPVHGLDPALRARQRRHLERGPGARPGADGGGWPVHHRVRHVHDHRRPGGGRDVPAAVPELMIEYREVHKTFDVPVLAGVSFTVETGETLAVVGPSGTGKSVLLKTTIGLIVPDEGDVFIDGQSVFAADPEQLQAIRRKAGYVFQNAALFDSMNVFENVAYGLPEKALKALGRREVTRRVSRALEEVNL